jgi:probable F420-dependent oxidoreductase
VVAAVPPLGRVGVWSGQLGLMPAPEARRVVQRVEALGFETLWINEAFGREALVHAAHLLHWTITLRIATGIANIWARDAVTMANGARSLSEAFPDRFVLGLGISHGAMVGVRGHEYGRPLETMRRYLDTMDQAPYRGPEPPSPTPIVLAALGPRMLELAAQRTAGVHSYFVPVEHTVWARRNLPADGLLAPEQAVVLETEAAAARRRARLHTATYLRLPNYVNNLRRLGWGEPDLAGDGSDALVDALVAWGDVEAVIARVRAHLDAGADHVAVQVLGPDPEVLCVEDLEVLAPHLLDRTQ